MATEIITRVRDDVDGTILDEDGQYWEQQTFTYKGVTYEIDLSEQNAALFHKQVGFYAEKGRKVTKKTAPKKTATKDSEDTTGKAVTSGAKAKARPGIRQWARDHGFDIAQRGGRVPEHVQAAYDIAHAPVQVE